MATKPALSATMALCLADAIEHGGKLVRFAGGYWSWSDCPRDFGDPAESFGTTTVRALVDRGVMSWCDWKRGSRAPFPVAAQVNAEYLRHDPPALRAQAARQIEIGTLERRHGRKFLKRALHADAVRWRALTAPNAAEHFRGDSSTPERPGPTPGGAGADPAPRSTSTTTAGRVRV